MAHLSSYDLHKLVFSSLVLQEEGGELDSHEEVRHFCGSRWDQEEGGGAEPSS